MKKCIKCKKRFPYFTIFKSYWLKNIDLHCEECGTSNHSSILNRVVLYTSITVYIIITRIIFKETSLFAYFTFLVIMAFILPLFYISKKSDKV